MLHKYITVENNNDQSFTNNVNQENINKNPLLDIIENKNSAHNEDKINYSRYNSEFELMKDNYETKLNNIVKAGYKEYKSGENSAAKLAMKYTNKAVQLEKEANNKFNNLLEDMEIELKTENQSNEIIKDLEFNYNNYKSNAETKVMKKLKIIYKK